MDIHEIIAARAAYKDARVFKSYQVQAANTRAYLGVARSDFVHGSELNVPPLTDGSAPTVPYDSREEGVVEKQMRGGADYRTERNAIAGMIKQAADERAQAKAAAPPVAPGAAPGPGILQRDLTTMVRRPATMDDEALEEMDQLMAAVRAVEAAGGFDTQGPNAVSTKVFATQLRDTAALTSESYALTRPTVDALIAKTQDILRRMMEATPVGPNPATAKNPFTPGIRANVKAILSALRTRVIKFNLTDNPDIQAYQASPDQMGADPRAVDAAAVAANGGVPPAPPAPAPGGAGGVGEAAPLPTRSGALGTSVPRGDAMPADSAANTAQDAPPPPPGIFTRAGVAIATGLGLMDAPKVPTLAMTEAQLVKNRQTASDAARDLAVAENNLRVAEQAGFTPIVNRAQNVRAAANNAQINAARTQAAAESEQGRSEENRRRAEQTLSDIELARRVLLNPVAKVVGVARKGVQKGFPTLFKAGMAALAATRLASDYSQGEGDDAAPNGRAAGATALSSVLSTPTPGAPSAVVPTPWSSNFLSATPTALATAARDATASQGAPSQVVPTATSTRRKSVSTSATASATRSEIASAIASALASATGTPTLTPSSAVSALFNSSNATGGTFDPVGAARRRREWEASVSASASASAAKKGRGAARKRKRGGSGAEGNERVIEEEGEPSYDPHTDRRAWRDQMPASEYGSQPRGVRFARTVPNAGLIGRAPGHVNQFKPTAEQKAAAERVASTGIPGNDRQALDVYRQGELSEEAEVREREAAADRARPYGMVTTKSAAALRALEGAGSRSVSTSKKRRFDTMFKALGNASGAR